MSDQETPTPQEGPATQESPQHQGAPQPTGFDLGTVIAQATQVITDPGGFYRGMAKGGGYSEPLIFALVMGVVSGLVFGVLSIIGLTGAGAAGLGAGGRGAGQLARRVGASEALVLSNANAESARSVAAELRGKLTLRTARCSDTPADAEKTICAGASALLLSRRSTFSTHILKLAGAGTRYSFLGRCPLSNVTGWLACSQVVS